jgi:hypothetical protein
MPIMEVAYVLHACQKNSSGKCSVVFERANLTERGEKKKKKRHIHTHGQLGMHSARYQAGGFFSCETFMSTNLGTLISWPDLEIGHAAW